MRVGGIGNGGCTVIPGLTRDPDFFRQALVRVAQGAGKACQVIGHLAAAYVTELHDF